MRVASVLIFAATAAAFIGKKDWKKVDMEAAAKSLEAGDSPDLLVDDDKLAMADYDKRRSKGLQKPEDDVALKEPSEWLRHSQAMSGPAMMFANVKDLKPDGTPYYKKDLVELSVVWQNLVKTAGLEAKVYDISDPDAKPTKRPPPGAPRPPTPTPPPPRLLISMNTGWRGYELRDFLLRRPELDSLEWDSVKFTPADLDENGNFRGGVRASEGMPIPKGLQGDDDGPPGGLPPGAVSVPRPTSSVDPARPHAQLEDDDEEL